MWLETVDPGSAAEHQRREGRNCRKYAPHRFNPPSEIEVELDVDWRVAGLKGVEGTETGRKQPKTVAALRRPW